jgi:hypothetical protein
MSPIQKAFRYPDHHPVTRRQFLGLGIGQALSLMFLPDLLSRFGNQALASGCETPLSSLHPFLLFDCVGGASLAGNFVVGKSGGAEDYLKSYDTMGVAKSPAAGQVVDTSFGLPLFTSLSKIHEGMLSQITLDTKKRLRMASICNSSQDDSSDNALSPAILISKAGLNGRYFKGGLGSMGTDSGGNSQSPIVDATMQPVAVSSLNDISESLNYGAALAKLSTAQRTRLAKTISRLSESQASKVAGMRMADQFTMLANCGLQKNIEFAGPIKGINPIENAAVAPLLQGATPEVTRLGAIAYNVLQRNCGVGVHTISGCDYHDGTQTTGDAKDLEIGVSIGVAVEMAARLKQPLFFAVISDGSTYSDVGTRIWRGDAGQKGLAVMGYYHPTNVPTLRTNQIGAFTDGQGVDRTTYVGVEPRRAAYTILANYLSVNGKLGEFETLVSQSEFEPSKLDSHIAFG